MTVLLPALEASEASPSARGERMRARLAEMLPRYDPAIRAKAVEAAAQANVEAAAEAAPPAIPAPAEQPVIARDAEPAVELPAVVVESPREEPRPKPGPALPRLPEVVHFKNIKPEPFESAAATEDRLERTYLSDLDLNVLNRFTLPFIGVKNIERARELELAEKNAETLNRLARVIELMEAFGLDAEEAKAMRKQYHELQRQRLQ